MPGNMKLFNTFLNYTKMNFKDFKSSWGWLPSLVELSIMMRSPISELDV